MNFQISQSPDCVSSTLWSLFQILEVDCQKIRGHMVSCWLGNRQVLLLQKFWLWQPLFHRNANDWVPAARKAVGSLIGFSQGISVPSQACFVLHYLTHYFHHHVMVSLLSTTVMALSMLWLMEVQFLSMIHYVSDSWMGIGQVVSSVLPWLYD